MCIDYFDRESLERWFKDKGDETHRLNYKIDKNSKIFDIGGYEGDWSNSIYSRYGSIIYIFEPIKKNYDFICNRFKNTDCINIYNYALSNKKLLKTGFKFLYDLENNIKEMIYMWSKKNINQNLEYVKNGENIHIDERGTISNYELTEPVNLIGLISSKKGTIRANHYHPLQEQKCLFTKGQIIEVFQDLLNPNSSKITQIVNRGQISVIKPNVAHAMVFTKDTTFLNLVRGERNHENYGWTMNYVKK